MRRPELYRQPLSTAWANPARARFSSRQGLRYFQLRISPPTLRVGRRPVEVTRHLHSALPGGTSDAIASPATVRRKLAAARPTRSPLTRFGGT
jgi:hypothetical protein